MRMLGTLLLMLLGAVSVANSQTYYNQTTIPPDAKTLYPRNYGFVCDGATDSGTAMTALNAAITTLSAAGGGVVYFQPQASVCLTSVALALKSNVTIYAEPGTVTLKPTTSSTADPVLLSSSGISNALVYGITFDGVGQDFGTANTVITIFQSTNVVFDHVTVQNTRGIGLLFSNTIVRSGVRASTFKNIGNHWKTTNVSTDRQQGISFCCGSVANSHDNFVYNSYFEDIGLTAVAAGTQTNFSAIGNVMELTNNQLSVVSATDYAGGIGSSSAGSPIGGVIANNLIIGATGNCIDMLGAVNVSITGNVVKNCGAAGIGVFDGDTGVTVSGNTIINTGQWASSPFHGGITFDGTTSNITISGNTAYDDQGGSQTQLYGLQFATTGGLPVVASNNLVLGPNNFAGNKNSPFGGTNTGSTIGIYGTTTNDNPAAGAVGEMFTVNCAATSTATITVTIATPAIVTWSSHPFSAIGAANWSCPINFTTSGTLPTGIVAGTNYWIIGSSLSGDTFQLSDTAAHALAATNAVATSGSQSGTQTGWMGALATNGTNYSAASANLTAGDWDCTGIAVFSELTSLTTVADLVGINTSGTALPAVGFYIENRHPSGSVGTNSPKDMAPITQELLSATTGVHLVAQLGFSAGTENTAGTLRCRRMR